MRIFNSSQNLILTIICFFVFIVYLKAQDSPQDFVLAHNQARSAVGVGLRWDGAVAAYARNYANYRKSDCIVRRSVGPYGENLAWSNGSMTGVEAVNMWVKEKNYYDYNSNTCAPGKVCGHYTQVVWRNSVKLGCAKVRCNNGQTFITCNYDPPGNWPGMRPYDKNKSISMV